MRSSFLTELSARLATTEESTLSPLSSVLKATIARTACRSRLSVRKDTTEQTRGSEPQAIAPFVLKVGTARKKVFPSPTACETRATIAVQEAFRLHRRLEDYWQRQEVCALQVVIASKAQSIRLGVRQARSAQSQDKMKHLTELTVLQAVTALVPSIRQPQDCVLPVITAQPDRRFRPRT